jgi:hypothetical protein
VGLDLIHDRHNIVMIDQVNQAIWEEVAHAEGSRPAFAQQGGHAVPPAAPFLCLKIDLSPQKVAELSLKIFPSGLPPVKATGASPWDRRILESSTRRPV